MALKHFGISQFLTALGIGEIHIIISKDSLSKLSGSLQFYIRNVFLAVNLCYKSSAGRGIKVFKAIPTSVLFSIWYRISIHSALTHFLSHTAMKADSGGFQTMIFFFELERLLSIFYTSIPWWQLNSKTVCQGCKFLLQFLRAET